MLLALVGPRYATTCRWGAAVGAVGGLVASAYLYWHFAHGPGATSLDAGEAYGYVALMLGGPFSVLVGPFGMPGLVLSAVATWSIVGAIIAGIGHLIARRIHEARHGLVPPAG